MIVEYARVRESVKHPERANPSDAGLDVFFCPEHDQELVLKAGESTLLDTGLKFAIPHGYMLQVMNRSSVASQRALVVGAHCIDSGYEGEVFIDLHNVGVHTQVIVSGEKIAQLVMVPVVPFRAQETDEVDLFAEPITISERGDGALGSTEGLTFQYDNEFLPDDIRNKVWTIRGDNE
jgi:dUTP pyrophosphatase